MVDVPRFELGASSMPRKRASKLRHTPSELAEPLRPFKGDGTVDMYECEGDDVNAKPEIPPGLIDDMTEALKGEEAPFLRHLGGNLSLEWLPSGESRLGLTRFECDHHELFRRKRLGVPPGDIVIALNPILAEDDALFKHTLAHELLHAVGLLDHDGLHSQIVRSIAPPPKMRDSPVLMRLRGEVLSKMPEGQWICGKCGYAWERRRVTLPDRCPKCASRFQEK